MLFLFFCPVRGVGEPSWFNDSTRLDSAMGIKKIHWVCWETLCQKKKKKAKGGLDIRNIFLFNQASLTTKAWNLITNPDTLLTKLMKEI